MFVLGLILILLAALVALVFVIGGANDGATLDLGGGVNPNLNVAVVFLAGALTLLTLVLGLVMLRIAARRAAARRRESKELHKVSAKLEQREAELRQERGDHPDTGTTAGTTAADTSTPSTGTSTDTSGPAPTGPAPTGPAPRDTTRGSTHEDPPTRTS